MNASAPTLRERRDGFALPMSVLLIGFLTAGVVAAFTRTTAEVRMIDNYRAEADAYALAEAGLERYLARGLPTPLDTALPGGTASVRAFLVRAPGGPFDSTLYLVRSTGQTAGTALVPPGRRSVAQYAFSMPGHMQVLSSWTSLSGLHKNGSSGTITGFDVTVNSDTCGGGVTKPGVAVPDGMYTLSGGVSPIYGDPPVKGMGTPAQMAAQMKIDWPSISDAASGTISPHSIYCTAGTYAYDPAWAPCGTWPTATQFADPNFWPVVMMNGSGPLPRNGKGTLVVLGDLTLGGGDVWDGIVLVGGRIIDNGNGDVSGAVVTGLNVLKGHVVGQSSRADGTKDYQYDSCKIRSAARGMALLIPISNAWVDNWRTW